MPDTIHNPFRVTLLGTGAPPPSLERFGPSTLVEVGAQKFIFDAGRGAMQRLHQLGIPFCDITGMFLTHHHSDHVVGFPDLWLTGWIGRPWGKRSTPLDVWGPQGTMQMMEHLPQAFAVDLARPQPKLSARRRKVNSSRNQGRRGLRSRRDPSERLRSRSRRRRIAGVRLSNRLSKSRRRAVRRHDVQRKPDRARARSRPIGARSHCRCGQRGRERAAVEKDRCQPHDPGAGGRSFRAGQAEACSLQSSALVWQRDRRRFDSGNAAKYAGPLMVGVDLLQIDVGREVQAQPFENASRR